MAVKPGSRRTASIAQAHQVCLGGSRRTTSNAQAHQVCLVGSRRTASIAQAHQVCLVGSCRTASIAQTHQVCLVGSRRTASIAQAHQVYLVGSTNKPQHSRNIYYKVTTLRPRQNRSRSADDILKCIFLNENVWISFTIYWSLIMAWRRSGD